MLFAWRTRPNCYHCFYQANWELVGLLEHHPDLFWHTVEIEEEIGAQSFSLKQNWPLRKIAENAESIKRKRCIDICKAVARRAQITFDLGDDFEDEEPDMLQVVSCGLFCGK